MAKYLILGGGAAGIAAAYKILQSSKTAEVQLFEPTGRYGGRANTDTSAIKGLPFDKGCVYIQDPDNPINPWPKIAQTLGYETLTDTTEYQFRKEVQGTFQNVNIHDVLGIDEIHQGIENNYNFNKNYPNRAVCNPLADDAETMAFALATTPFGPFTESTEPWNYLAADRAREATGNWGQNLFVKKGLGSLVREYGLGIKEKYGSRFTETFRAIRSINYTTNQVQVTDTQGKVYPGDACIVTLPVSLLAQNKITFTPDLPYAHKQALRYLQLGAYKKLAVQVEKMPSDFKDNTNYYLYNPEPDGVWQMYRLPFYPQNTIVVHTSGEFATALDAMSPTAALALFKKRFKEAYGNTIKFTSHSGLTQWSKDQYTKGAYSFTAPIGNDPNNPVPLQARVQLKTPLQRKVFLAGEAYHLQAYGTLHGAYDDGKEAAENALRNFE